MPGREDFWNIGYPMLGALVYLTVPVIVAALAWGLWRRARMWRLGGPADDMGPWGERVRGSLGLGILDILAHRKFIRHELYAGLMHFALFWGFAMLLIATALVALEFNAEKYLDWTLPTVRYRVQTGFVWDVFGGLLATAGIAMAAYRRQVIRPPRLVTRVNPTIMLAYLFLILFTGYLLEGLRIGSTELNPASGLYDPDTAVWSPVGWAFAKLADGVGMTPAAMEAAHKWTWWTHVAIFTAGFVYIALGYRRLAHIVVSPAHAFLRSRRPRGALRPMGDFETLETFGARDLPGLSWLQLMGFDACTNCGRCQDQCPAHATGKPLSPRRVMQHLRLFMDERASVLLNTPAGETPPPPETPIYAGIGGEEAIWACTSCAACVEACPVFIDHIDTIVDIRRYLVLEESRMPETAQDALLNLEQRGHPWRGTTLTRTSWMEGQHVPTIEENPDADVLLWVGCTGALVDRNVSVTQAAASLLRKAGVSFAVLGARETCTGDPARRMGNEYLFQVLAMQTIETLRSVGQKTILTTCPHCFNTIRNEYPQFDAVFDVQHYSEFFARLLEEGRLRPTDTAPDAGSVTYHDSCFLGRHNGIYDAPRRIAKAIPGLRLSEMKLCKERGFCCGAGGGRMWMEEEGERISHARTDQFLETDGDTLAVSCPFCLQMFEESIDAKGVQESKQAKDLLEVLDEHTEGAVSPPPTT